MHDALQAWCSHPEGRHVQPGCCPFSVRIIWEGLMTMGPWVVIMAQPGQQVNSINLPAMPTSPGMPMGA